MSSSNGHDEVSSPLETETFSRAETSSRSTDEESAGLGWAMGGEEGAVVAGVSVSSASTSPSSSEDS